MKDPFTNGKLPCPYRKEFEALYITCTFIRRKSPLSSCTLVYIKCLSWACLCLNCSWEWASSSFCLEGKFASNLYYSVIANCSHRSNFLMSQVVLHLCSFFICTKNGDLPFNDEVLFLQKTLLGTDDTLQLPKILANVRTSECPKRWVCPSVRVACLYTIQG